MLLFELVFGFLIFLEIFPLNLKVPFTLFKLVFDGIEFGLAICVPFGRGIAGLLDRGDNVHVLFLVLFELMFELSVLDFFGLKLFDDFGHLYLVDSQSGFELLSFIFGLKILELEIFRLLLELIDLSPESFYFLVIKFSIDVKELYFKALVEFLQFINLIALGLIFLSEFVILNFELFKNPNLSLDLLLLHILIFLLILLIYRMRKRRVQDRQLFVHRHRPVE